MHFLCNFFAEIFGHIKKKQYFCIRFRSKNGQRPRTRAMIFEKMSIHNKIVVQELRKK